MIVDYWRAFGKRKRLALRQAQDLRQLGVGGWPVFACRLRRDKQRQGQNGYRRRGCNISVLSVFIRGNRHCGGRWNLVSFRVLCLNR